MNPTPEEQAHSLRTKAVILDEIRQNKGISFKRFMELALYAPELGYYRNQKIKLGTRGDFVTAPEISSLFSYALARQCQEVAASLPHFSILELGAGSGIMARDILIKLNEINCLPDKYYILEVSGQLKATQEETLNSLPESIKSKLVWLTSLPKQFIGIILANEVMDAMPAQRLTFDQGRLYEWYVVENKGEFNWERRPLKHPLPHLNDYLSYAQYHTEANPNLPSWFKSLDDTLEKGIVILFDYGYPRDEYYHPDRSMGTLMCYFHHQGHDDPLLYPGVQDITTHVDFTHVIESASEAGFDLLGYTTQAGFLMDNGIMEDYQARLLNYPEQQASLAKQFKDLTFPTEMGEAIKVMALGKHYDSPLKGFLNQDLSHRL